MDLRARRALLPALLAAAFLLLAGWHAIPARAASVDPELVAESVTEDGYYVDSSASYYRTDADLDRLRSALEKSGKAGVVVLPAGSDAGAVLTRLLQSPNRRATYIVLTGTRLQAASNSLPRATVQKMTARASRASDPKMKVMTFLDLLTAKKRAKSGESSGQKAGNLPDTTGSAGTDGEGVNATPTGAADHDSGGNGMLFGIAGAVVVAAAAVVGFLLWRRKKNRPAGEGTSA